MDKDDDNDKNNIVDTDLELTINHHYAGNIKYKNKNNHKQNKTWDKG